MEIATVIIVTPFVQSASPYKWFTRVHDGLLLQMIGNKMVAYGFIVADHYKLLTEGPKLTNIQGIELADQSAIDKDPLIKHLKSKLPAKLITLYGLGPTFFLDVDNMLVLERLPSGKLALHGKWNGTAPQKLSDEDIKLGRKLGYFILDDGPKSVVEDDSDSDEDSLNITPLPKLGEDYFKDMKSSLVVKMVKIASIVGNWDGDRLVAIPDQLKSRAEEMGLPIELEI